MLTPPQKVVVVVAIIVIIIIIIIVVVVVVIILVRPLLRMFLTLVERASLILTSTVIRARLILQRLV